MKTYAWETHFTKMKLLCLRPSGKETLSMRIRHTHTKKSRYQTLENSKILLRWQTENNVITSQLSVNWMNQKSTQRADDKRGFHVVSTRLVAKYPKKDVAIKKTQHGDRHGHGSINPLLLIFELINSLLLYRCTLFVDGSKTLVSRLSFLDCKINPL